MEVGVRLPYFFDMITSFGIAEKNHKCSFKAVLGYLHVPHLFFRNLALGLLPLHGENEHES